MRHGWGLRGGSLHERLALSLGLGLGCLWLAAAGACWGQTERRERSATGPRGRTVERQVEIRRTPGGVERDIRIQRPGGATYERDVRLQRMPGGVERDIRIQRPGGATFERDVRLQRMPGGVERQIQIQRPGAVLERDVVIERAPAMRGPRYFPRGWGLPAWGYGPRPLVIAEPVVPAVGFGMLAAPFLNFSFGGAGGGFGAAIGGPVVAAPAPVPVPVAPVPPAPPPPPPDQVALMCQRLQSFSPGARREAAEVLGRLGDPRAVPSLIHVLKYDYFKDVRIASAISLGEIGGARAAVALERCAVYDHRESVRQAAARALDRLNARTRAASAAMPAPAGTPAAPGQPPPSLSGAAPLPPKNAASAPFSQQRPTVGADAGTDETPPPPPQPVPPPR